MSSPIVIIHRQFHRHSYCTVLCVSHHTGLLNHGFIIMHNVIEKLHQYLFRHLAYHSVLFLCWLNEVVITDMK